MLNARVLFRNANGFVTIELEIKHASALKYVVIVCARVFRFICPQRVFRFNPSPREKAIKTVSVYRLVLPCVKHRVYHPHTILFRPFVYMHDLHTHISIEFLLFFPFFRSLNSLGIFCSKY